MSTIPPRKIRDSVVLHEGKVGLNRELFNDVLHRLNERVEQPPSKGATDPRVASSR